MNLSSPNLTSSRFARGLSYGLRLALVSYAFVAGFALQRHCDAGVIGVEMSGTLWEGPGGAWPEETPFFLTIYYNTAVSGSFNSFDSMTDYNNSIDSFVMTVGAYRFAFDKSDSSIRVGNDLFGGITDRVIFNAYGFAGSPAASGYSMAWMQVDLNGDPATLSGVALPTSVAPLQSFAAGMEGGTNLRMTSSNTSNIQHVTYGYITSVSAVPEPSTYAMALAGLACGGFSMWRRRTRA